MASEVAGSGGRKALHCEHERRPGVTPDEQGVGARDRGTAVHCGRVRGHRRHVRQLGRPHPADPQRAATERSRCRGRAAGAGSRVPVGAPCRRGTDPPLRHPHGGLDDDGGHRWRSDGHRGGLPRRDRAGRPGVVPYGIRVGRLERGHERPGRPGGTARRPGDHVALPRRLQHRHGGQCLPGRRADRDRCARHGSPDHRGHRRRGHRPARVPIVPRRRRTPRRRTRSAGQGRPRPPRAGPADPAHRRPGPGLRVRRRHRQRLDRRRARRRPSHLGRRGFSRVRGIPDRHGDGPALDCSRCTAGWPRSAVWPWSR